MDTQALRTMVQEAAQKRGARLWPNRLGFDWRRWEYSYNEVFNTWQALYRPAGYGNGQHTWYGRGPTPDSARAAARKVKG